MHNSHGPVAPTNGFLRPLTAARLDRDGLLGRWQERNRAATLPHCIEQLHAHGNLDNLRRVTGDTGGAAAAYAGYWFADTDVYKTLEAALWHGSEPEFIADTVELLAKVQDPDGYLVSYFQLAANRDRQWAELPSSHEMYSAGHLIQAAVAAARGASGDPVAQQLVEVARRFADLLVRRFGAGGEDAVDGHPEIETALVELFRVTGHRAYLDLAARLVNLRGHGLLGPESRFGQRAYYQDHAPVRAAAEATGHVVRQVYLLAGAVDVAVETGDAELLAAAERLWDSALTSKTYITGGQGSRHRDEAFGDAYELPPDRAYAETCAAIGSFQLAWRLLLATGRARYADEMERLLYNGIAASTALDGTGFFYSNPLQLRTGHDGSDEDAPGSRLPWYRCACCPPNLARRMASLHTYAATGDPEGLQLQLYAQGSFSAHGNAVEVETQYPWDGTVTVTVTESTGEPWTLALRIPGWCADARVSDPDAVVADGYARIRRAWRAGDRVELTLDMPPRLVAAHPRVDAVRGTAALARGPVVYCLEQAGLPAELTGVVFEDLMLDASAPLDVVRDHPVAPVALAATARVADAGDGALYGPLGAAPSPRSSATVHAIPYHLWANREPGPMRVWIPVVPPPR